MSLLTAAETIPFGVAFALLIALAAVEGLGAFVAHSPSSWLDHVIPDSFDGPDGPLGWLHFGKVPILVLIILFLLGFSLGGYTLQLIARGLLGSYAPAWLASIPAFLLGLTVVRALGALIAHIIPKDETSAISEQQLIGRAGIVVAGTARVGLAAEVRVKDSLGRMHYLMVEPDLSGDEFQGGTEVLIVKKVGAIYRGIKNPHPSLLN